MMPVLAKYFSINFANYIFATFNRLIYASLILRIVGPDNANSIYSIIATFGMLSILSFGISNYILQKSLRLRSRKTPFTSRLLQKCAFQSAHLSAIAVILSISLIVYADSFFGFLQIRQHFDLILILLAKTILFFYFENINSMIRGYVSYSASLKLFFGYYICLFISASLFLFLQAKSIIGLSISLLFLPDLIFTFVGIFLIKKKNFINFPYKIVFPTKKRIFEISPFACASFSFNFYPSLVTFVLAAYFEGSDLIDFKTLQVIFGLIISFAGLIQSSAHNHISEKFYSSSRDGLAVLIFSMLGFYCFGSFVWLAFNYFFIDPIFFIVGGRDFVLGYFHLQSVFVLCFVQGVVGVVWSLIILLHHQILFTILKLIAFGILSLSIFMFDKNGIVISIFDFSYHKAFFDFIFFFSGMCLVYCLSRK